MMLSRRALAARFGPSAASIRDIELNSRPEKFRLRTLHALDHSLDWTPGTAIRLATGDPKITDAEFAQLVDNAQGAPIHVPKSPIATDIADTADADSKQVPLGSDTSDGLPLNVNDVRSLDTVLFKAFGQLRVTVSQIKADMTLRSITDDTRDQRDIDYRIIRSMNELETLTAELQEAVHPPTGPDTIATALSDVLDRSSPGPSPGPDINPETTETEVFV